MPKKVSSATPVLDVSDLESVSDQDTEQLIEEVEKEAAAATKPLPGMTAAINATAENAAARVVESVMPSAVPAGMINADMITMFANIIAQAISKGIAATQPVKAVTIGQYLKARRRDVKLIRETFQNNYRVMDVGANLSDLEIQCLNRIRRPGRYLGRRVEVVILNQGGDFENEVVQLRYSDRDVNQRLENAKYWTSFEDLVVKILAEQDEKEAEEAQYQRPRSKA